MVMKAKRGGRFRLLMAGSVIAALGGCVAGGTGPVNLSVSGSAAVGASTSSGGVTNLHVGAGLAGPPPGRTSAERAARKEYYRGPRGREF
jgi:hypothetical protein